MRNININGKDFARAIRVCRKFATRNATAMAISTRDMFILEVQTRKGAPGVEVWFWASDGYRAVRVKVPVVSGAGGPFIAAIRNPVFTPREGAHVSIELASVKKEPMASVRYHEYGTVFTTSQAHISQDVKNDLAMLKGTMEGAERAEVKAQFVVQGGMLKEALDAAVIANEEMKAPVTLSVGKESTALRMQAGDMHAIVLPLDDGQGY